MLCTWLHQIKEGVAQLNCMATGNRAGPDYTSGYWYMSMHTGHPGVLAIPQKPWQSSKCGEQRLPGIPVSFHGNQ